MSGKRRISGKPPWFISDVRINIILVTLTILLGILLSEMQSKLGWSLAVISVTAIAAVIVTVTGLVIRPVLSIILDIEDDVNDTLETIQSTKGKGWLRTTDQAVRYERRCQSPEIWLISADLSEDVVGGPFVNVVAYNLARGIRYRYFVPDVPEVRARVLQIEAYHKNHENLNFTYLNDDFFFLVEDLDFLIYNPIRECGVERIAYMGLPLAGANGRHHARISEVLVDRLIGKLIQMETS